MSRQPLILSLAAAGAAALFIAAASIVGCSYSTDIDPPPASRAASRLAAFDPPPGTGVAAGPAQPGPGVERGKELFASQGCMACHAVKGQGGSLASDLTNEGRKGRTRQWLIEQLTNPQGHDPKAIMPGYAGLGAQQLNDLADYLASLPGGEMAATPGPTTKPQATPAPASPLAEKQAELAALRAKGAKLWAENCNRCHNYQDPGSRSDAEWEVAVQHMRIRVPLTGQEQRAITEFLKASN